ncbi:hypothetical protein EB796_000920 [Bugula neritina]|uniref:Uncharacterized protein n=1 Tax=Bugula neritina TaxID=10212 RepID=A0A7J7KRK4_BUGNE|nr:hypothetical protein EB796_000920 [Bugula neritina]
MTILLLVFRVQARGEHHVEIAKTHKIIARLCLKANKYKQAEEHLLQALKIYRACTIQMADSDAMWNTHDLLAQTYMHLGKKDLEVEHYQRAIEILSNSTDLPPERLAHMHNNIGVTLHKLNRHHESQLHLEKSKEMMTLIHGNTDNEDMAKVHKSLGDLYKDIGRWDEAASEYTSFLKVYSKPAMAAVGQVLSAPVHKALAEIYEIKGNLSKAREHAQLSDQGQEQLNNPENTELMNELAGRLGSGNLMIAAKDANEEVEKAQRYQRENNHQLAIKTLSQGYTLNKIFAIDCVQNLPPLTRDTHEVTSKLAMIHNNLGNAYRSVSRFAEAKTHMLKALEIRRQLYGDDVCEDTATSLFNLGYIYSQVSDVPNLVESFNCHKEALRMYLQMGISTDTLKWVVGLYRSLASTSYNLGEAQQSVEYYEKARATISQHAQEGDGEMVKQLQAICNNIGNSYKSLKNYKKAEENLKHALDMATALHLGNPDDLEYQNDQAAAHNNLGCLYQEMKQYQKAIEHHRESLTMRRQIAPLYADAATDLPSSLHNIGNAYNSAGELNEALKYYEEEYKVRMNLGEETSDVLISMSKVYEKKGNLSKAEECLRMAGN